MDNSVNQNSGQKKAIIIGGGPAGLTAALEFLRHTNIKPIIIELDSQVGGLSKTVNYKGNRIDIGGHRFFSKSDTVLKWWFDIFPIEPKAKGVTISYQNKTKTLSSFTKHGVRKNKKHQSVKVSQNVFMIRNRLSRILFKGKLFDYPLNINLTTLKKLGFKTTLKFISGYIRRKINPIKPEVSLEDFMINRFGDELYHLFFKEYSEKVWGKPCNEISKEWGSQRIKGISIFVVVADYFKNLFKSSNKDNGKGFDPKSEETSLIQQFLYPPLGPGQLWEEVARQIISKGGEILLNTKTVSFNVVNGNIESVIVKLNGVEGEEEIKGDYFASTMPIKDLVMQLKAEVPADVYAAASNLEYRDFLTVGLLLKKECITLEDNWIYVQEPGVLVGRVQVFNNWSPFLVKDKKTVWVGLEYFSLEGDTFWSKSDEQIAQIAKNELEKIGLAKAEYVIDSTVVRAPKAYPGYFGTYEHIDKVREYLFSYNNLFLLGRNGLHRYNNQDHSMLTAIEMVNQIKINKFDKWKICNINSEEDYHETKK